MTPSRRQELRALCDAATPGPWWPRDATRRGTVESHCGHVCTAGFLETCEPDAAFIAAARTAVPELLDEVEKWQHAEAAAVDAHIAMGAELLGWKQRADAAEKERDELDAEAEKWSTDAGVAWGAVEVAREALLAIADANVEVFGKPGQTWMDLAVARRHIARHALERLPPRMEP